jgi:hypothetical protein
MRETNVQLRTSFSAGLLPPLRHHEVAPKVNRKLAAGELAKIVIL